MPWTATTSFAPLPKVCTGSVSPAGGVGGFDRFMVGSVTRLHLDWPAKILRWHQQLSKDRGRPEFEQSLEDQLDRSSSSNDALGSSWCRPASRTSPEPMMYRASSEQSCRPLLRSSGPVRSGLLWDADDWYAPGLITGRTAQDTLAIVTAHLMAVWVPETGHTSRDLLILVE
jgi:hypothetical protein